MRSSLVPRSEGGEEGPGERGCAGGVRTTSLDNWTCTRAGAGGGFWLGHCHSHKAYREVMQQLLSNPRALMSHFDSRIKLKDVNFASKALSSPLHTVSTQDTSAEHSLET